MTYNALVSIQKLVLDQNNPTKHYKPAKSWEVLTTKCKALQNDTHDPVRCPIHAWQMAQSIQMKIKAHKSWRKNKIKAEMA